MKLITEIKIENFRSIKRCKITDIKDFNSLFGLNNSGKSNVLRALNLFFNDETDNEQALDFDSDFHQSSSKKKKEIKITVKFKLPQNFKFKKKLKKVEQIILKKGREVTIKKVFGREYPFPEKIYLNEKIVPEKSLRDIDRFLNLINFRYIPNRVLPVEILKGESYALKTAIARKINKQKKDKNKIKTAAKDLSKAISKMSERFIAPISKELKEISPNTTVELITPSLVEDLISTSGYFLNTDNVRVKDIYQGSGIQSFLMFHTLHLIDKDYAQQFGWKQATIWAVEEPESSLHSDLEAQLALFLFQTVINKNSRLQFFCTTHSTMFSQYSQQSVIIEKSSNGTTCRSVELKSLYKEASRLGISRHTHPLLYCPVQDILLCEGKTDVVFIKKVFGLLGLDETGTFITDLSELENNDEKGGKDAIQKYIKENRNIIENRYEAHKTKVVVLLDWDVKINAEWEKIKKMKGVSVVKWPEDKISVKTKNLKGIESLYPERFFEEALRSTDFKETLSIDGSGNYTYPRSKIDDQKLKSYLIKKLKSELSKKDIIYLKSFIENKIITIEK